MLFVLFIAVAVAPYAYAIGVFSLICNDPNEDCSGWTPISTAISEHPRTKFYSVVNTADICVGSPGSQSRIRKCIPSLQRNNSVILGYVDTDDGSTRVHEEIDAYTGWNSSIRPVGIFFDCTDASSVTKYQSYLSHARGKGFNFIVLNSEEPPNPDYYNQADLIVTYNDDYDIFKLTRLKFSSSTPASKQVVVLSGSPTSGYNTTVSALASAGIAALYITDGSFDNGVSGYWREFVNEVAGPGIVSNTTSTALLPSSATIISTDRPSSNPTKKTTPPLPIGAIVGGVVGGVAMIIVFAIIIFLMRRRQKRLARLRDSSVDPFRSLHRQTIVESNHKSFLSTQQTGFNDYTGPSHYTRPLSMPNYQPVQKRNVEFLSPALPSASTSREGPPPYSVPPSDSGATATE